MKEELEKRMKAIDIARGGDGDFTIEIVNKVELSNAVMYVVCLGSNTCSFIGTRI